MKKMKKLGLIIIVIMGTLIFAECGWSSKNPVNVADKFVNDLFKENLQTEKSRMKIKALMDSSILEVEKERSLEYCSVTKMAEELFTRSEKEEMEMLGMGDEIEVVAAAMRKLIKIERVDSEIDQDVAHLSYVVIIPKINTEELGFEIEAASKKIRYAAGMGKIGREEEMKQCIKLKVDMYIDALRNAKDFYDEKLFLTLIRKNGKWYVGRG